jgi:multiple sugar transport system substrate-binding protein
LKVLGRKLYWLLAIACFIVVVSCSDNLQSEQSQVVENSSETGELNIWWDKGYSYEEDEALQTVVDNWQKQTGHKAKLSFYTTSELSTKAERAVKSGNPPDLMMNNTADRILYPRLAWQGKLEDVSDIIEPIEDSYVAPILESAIYRNSVTEGSSYYTVPLYQATTLIFYWQKLLAQVGFTPGDIPQDWEKFWQFWQQVQSDLKTKQQQNIYALGLPFSTENGTDDMYITFEHILEAYNVTSVDPQGELLIDDPEVRQGIINCLDWYSQFYKQGNVPPDAIHWSATDNNRNLLNRLVVMTPNTTFSIPAAIRQDTDTYYHQLGVSEFPNKPDGSPMRYLVAVRQAAIFTDSTHISLAKDFLKYFLQPQVMRQYLQASGNRNQPVQKSLWEDPFWLQTSDPYLAIATKIFTQDKTRLFAVVNNPAYSDVLQQNVWGKALNRIVIDGLSAEEAGDEAIAQVKNIFAAWK